MARMTPFANSDEPQSDVERAMLDGFIKGLGWAVLKVDLCRRFSEMAEMKIQDSGEVSFRACLAHALLSCAPGCNAAATNKMSPKGCNCHT